MCQEGVNREDIPLCECGDTFLMFDEPVLPCGRCGLEIPWERTSKGLEEAAMRTAGLLVTKGEA